MTSPDKPANPVAGSNAVQRLKARYEALAAAQQQAPGLQSAPPTLSAPAHTQTVAPPRPPRPAAAAPGTPPTPTAATVSNSNSTAVREDPIYNNTGEVRAALAPEEPIYENASDVQRRVRPARAAARGAGQFSPPDPTLCVDLQDATGSKLSFAGVKSFDYIIGPDGWVYLYPKGSLDQFPRGQRPPPHAVGAWEYKFLVNDWALGARPLGSLSIDTQTVSYSYDGPPLPN